MKITNVTRTDLDAALETVNKAFANNVTWNRIEPANRKGTAWTVTLRVVSSKEPGHRLGFPSNGKQRHLVSACWHVHGTFFDALPRCAVIHANRATIYPGDRWQDRNIGSQNNPLYYSEACECS